MANTAPYLHLAELTASQFLDIWKHFDADGKCNESSWRLSAELRKDARGNLAVKKKEEEEETTCYVTG